MNNNNIQTGKQGEQLAATYRLNMGYTLLELNWRHHHWELDIIAANANTLHFVEVKTRTSLLFGYPEEHISRKKMRHLSKEKNLKKRRKLKLIDFYKRCMTAAC
jgi:putative endonuclease